MSFVIDRQFVPFDELSLERLNALDERCVVDLVNRVDLLAQGRCCGTGR